MAKVEVEAWKKEYPKFKDINSKLRTMCDCYCISKDGVIYMHSLVPFIEKMAVLKKDTLEEYREIAVLPNQTFEWMKPVTKTSLISREVDDITMVLESSKIDELLTISKVDCDDEKFMEDIRSPKGKMYTCFNTLYRGYDSIMNPDRYPNKSKLMDISDKIEAINDSELVEFELDGHLISISRQIFPRIKKDNSLMVGIIPLNERIIDDESGAEKIYVIFEEMSDDMAIYTLMAFMDV